MVSPAAIIAILATFIGATVLTVAAVLEGVASYDICYAYGGVLLTLGALSGLYVVIVED